MAGSQPYVIDSGNRQNIKLIADSIELSDGTTAQAAIESLRERLDNANATDFYGVCSTGTDVAAKEVNITGFKLETGVDVKVKFTKMNVAKNPTLNVSNTGAKAIYSSGSVISADVLSANTVIEFVYDGTNYNMIGGSVGSDIDYQKAAYVDSFDAETATLNLTSDGSETDYKRVAYIKSFDTETATLYMVGPTNNVPKPYLSFVEKNKEPFTLKTNNTSKKWNGTLEYSTDTKNWTEWDGTEISSSNDGKLYLRGTNNTKITGENYDSSYKWVLTTGKSIQCDGNIENLLDYQTVKNNGHPVMDSCCYKYMFYNCTSLTAAPELPAETLSSGCYYGMFSKCTSLTSAPSSLPAIKLKSDCYGRMFQGCTSLTNAPSLPATTLAQSCYGQMFDGCTSLASAPSLPATTLAFGCYDYMFNGCTSLTSAPNLPATTLESSCYSGMFRDCTSLTGQIHCASSTSGNSYCLTADDISGTSATIVFDL